MFISLFIVTAVWIIVTFVTKPCDKEKLKSFYRLVKPPGPLWKPISTELEAEEGIRSPDNLKVAFIGWLFSNPMTFGFLFGFGNLFLQRFTQGFIWLAIGLISAVITFRCVRRMTASK